MNNELPPDLNIDYIKSMINIIKSDISKLKSEQLFDNHKCEMSIMETYSDFYLNYPFLVKQLIKSDDINYIYYMLDKILNIQKGTASLKDTEAILGNQLAEMYIYPHLSK